MYQDIIYQDLDKTIDHLEHRTVAWFTENKHQPPAGLFYLYLRASRTGEFCADYARLLDGSMVCLSDILPQLAHRFAPRIATAAELPGLKTRRILSMLLYWLSQHHSGQSDALPGREEVMDIFSSILENTTLRLW
ncbi:hypothetical protein DFO53_2473 [Enterobacter sp. AG5470]|nr:hypothetical protein DFO53_2473 [Enterobacter sp. AG5470]